MKKKTSEQLEREIRATRQRLDETLDALRYKTSPEHVKEQIGSFLTERRDRMANSLMPAGSKLSLVPLAMLGISIGWLIISQRRSPAVEALQQEAEPPTLSSPPVVPEHGTALVEAEDQVPVVTE